MRVTLISRSDRTGGAAVVTFRLMEALRSRGVDASMLVVEKLTGSQYVTAVGEGVAGKLPFLEERLQIFLQNGLDRRDLFKADTAAFGLPLSRHPLVRDADAVCLGWVNQGMLSLREIGHIAADKPVIWTMHDMWNLTGVCHHACDCRGYMAECGECPLLGRSAGKNDLSRRVWRKKSRLYSEVGITFVAVSSWLAGKAAESSLLGNQDVRVIPNPFPVADMLAMKGRDGESREGDDVVMVMGAARLDDPIKGLPVLRNALAKIRDDNPGFADRLRLLTFGRFKNPAALEGLAVRHTHLGPLATPRQVADAYRSADIVVSSSLFETLPGTLVEGMAYGCIPVSLDRGGQRDIVDDGVTGFLAHYGDTETSAAESLAAAIAKAASVAGDRAGAGIMRENGLKAVEERFAAGAVADRYIRLIEEKIRRNGKV